MDSVGYIRDDQGKAHALTYGAQADMDAWLELNKQVNPTSALYAAKSGDDLPRCLVDDAYFQGLVG